VPQPDYLVLPDGCVDVLFSPRIGLQVVGAMTAAQAHALEVGDDFVGIRFQPGSAGRFLGVAPGELTDLSIPLEEVWGTHGRRLCDQLQNASSASTCAHLLAESMRPAPGYPSAIERAIAALVAEHGAADLDWLARQANLSSRQLRRRCRELTGLTPKQLVRVLRFRHAVDLLSFGAGRGWAHLAAECGYYDQSHFIHEFREFSGSTPAEYYAAQGRDGRFFQSGSSAVA
jgi:AraC-like DNA-binding protein